MPLEEDLLDIDNPLNEGDEYSIDHYLSEEQYCDFEAMMSEMRHDIYNLTRFGHEDGPEAYAAECFAEEQLEQEIAEEYAWEDHLNPIQAFEKQKTWELEILGSYPDSHDRYEYYGLQAEETADEFGPEPRSEAECQY